MAAGFLSLSLWRKVKKQESIIQFNWPLSNLIRRKWIFHIDINLYNILLWISYIDVLRSSIAQTVEPLLVGSDGGSIPPGMTWFLLICFLLRSFSLGGDMRRREPTVP